MMHAASARERLFAASSVVAAAGALGVLYFVNPGTSTLFPPCPFLAFTGCYCPGCGSLRALHQITRGHLATALGLNPLLVLSLPFVGYFFVSRASLALSESFLRSPGVHLGSAGGHNAVLGRKKRARLPVLAARPLSA